MFTAALFTIANIRKQSKCPSADEWIRKMCYIHIQWSTTQPKKKNEICSNIGGSRKYHAQQNKRQKEILYITHM